MTLDPLAVLAGDRKTFHGGRVNTPVGGGATTDVPEKLFYTDERTNYTNGARVVNLATFTPDVGASAVTASDTNFHTLIVKRYSKTGTGGTQVGSVNTKAAQANGLTALTTTSAFVFRASVTDLTAGSNAASQAVVNVATGKGADFLAGDFCLLTHTNLKTAENLIVSSVSTDAVTMTTNLVNTYPANSTLQLLDPKTLAPGDLLTYKTTHGGTPNAAFPAGTLAVDLNVP